MKKLEDKVYALRKVWGKEDIDRVLIWCFNYAEVEASHLQLHADCGDQEYERRLALLARTRTTETVDQLMDLTNLSRQEISKKLERDVEYSELKETLKEMKIKFNFICTNNYEALIHKRHYGEGKKPKQLKEIFE